MKKKIFALMLCVAMLAIAVVGGTMAYFTDTETVKNTMTTGKVDISQLEQQRDDSGNLVAFTQKKPLLPAVYAGEINEDNIVQNGYFNPAVKNAVDKIITVKNEAATGAVNQDAYVRTIIAFETGTEYEANTTNVLRDGKEIFKAYIGTLGDFELLERGTITIDDVQYVLAVKVYKDALEPQEVTTPSLKQIFMSPQANNEVAILFGNEYSILAVSQATQTAGFDSAAEALNAAFGIVDGEGKVDDATIASWLTGA